MINLLLGDCLEKIQELEDNSVHSIVCDPPYEIGFMSKSWDNTGIAYNVKLWKECLRVLKPGGYILAFGATRTYHRMTIAIEDAGFDIRDCIMWVYSVGFPKSSNIGKSIDKKLGNERLVVGTKSDFSRDGAKRIADNHKDLKDAAEEISHKYGYKNGWDTLVDIGTSEWEGWGTSLKPAVEPIVMARKPFKGTVADNVLIHQTGGINIDGCRIQSDDDFSNVKPRDITKLNTKRNDETEEEAILRKKNGNASVEDALDKLKTLGRFPANLIHDGSDEVVSLFKNNADRFFYSAKVSKKDRNEGCEELINHHPTVKPTELMRYLCKLVTPKDGIVLDPFMGSGSTGKACVLEGFSFIGIELNEEYYNIANKRIHNAK